MLVLKGEVYHVPRWKPTNIPWELMDLTSHRVRFRHLTEGEVKADLEMPHLGKEEYKGWIVLQKRSSKSGTELKNLKEMLDNF